MLILCAVMALQLTMSAQSVGTEPIHTARQHHGMHGQVQLSPVHDCHVLIDSFQDIIPDGFQVDNMVEIRSFFRSVSSINDILIRQKIECELRMQCETKAAHANLGAAAVPKIIIDMERLGKVLDEALDFQMATELQRTLNVDNELSHISRLDPSVVIEAFRRHIPAEFHVDNIYELRDVLELHEYSMNRPLVPKAIECELKTQCKEQVARAKMSAAAGFIIHIDMRRLVKVLGEALDLEMAIKMQTSTEVDAENTESHGAADAAGVPGDQESTQRSAGGTALDDESVRLVNRLAVKCRINLINEYQLVFDETAERGFWIDLWHTMTEDFDELIKRTHSRNLRFRGRGQRESIDHLMTEISREKRIIQKQNKLMKQALENMRQELLHVIQQEGKLNRFMEIKEIMVGPHELYYSGNRITFMECNERLSRLIVEFESTGKLQEDDLEQLRQARKELGDTYKINEALLEEALRSLKAPFQS